MVRGFLLNVLLLAVSLIGALALVEFGARAIGLGQPVLYDSHPFYGYRPLPAQAQRRSNVLKGGGRVVDVRINNLGLRCARDWDGNPHGKLLFLGDSVTYGGSYVSEDELFSSLAAAGTGWDSCNGGVNAWGIENLHGLVVEAGFHPAEVYVTTVPEGDFYRGLTRIQGQPFYNRQPGWALEEALQYAAFVLMERRYVNWQQSAPAELRRAVVERAALRLAEMTRVLAGLRFRHVLLITPDRAQAAGRRPPDPIVREALAHHDLKPVYLRDELRLAPEDVPALYVDSVHLSPAGHRRWAEAISRHLPAA